MTLVMCVFALLLWSSGETAHWSLIAVPTFANKCFEQNAHISMLFCLLTNTPITPLESMISGLFSFDKAIFQFTHFQE
jgi:hypothetical protein